MWCGLLLRLGDKLLNGKLHCVGNEVHSSIYTDSKIDWDKLLRKTGGSMLGDMGCNDSP